MYTDHEETNWVKRIFMTLFFLGMVGGLAGLGYMYYKTRQELKFLASPAGQEELGRRATQQTVDALAKLAILPPEEPVIATITDKDALASQSAFYKNAENGDKLVVFAQAQQAYIYSPSRNKIVNVGPLIIEGQDGSQEFVVNQQGETITNRSLRFMINSSRETRLNFRAPLRVLYSFRLSPDGQYIEVQASSTVDQSSVPWGAAFPSRESPYLMSILLSE